MSLRQFTGYFSDRQESVQIAINLRSAWASRSNLERSPQLEVDDDTPGHTPNLRRGGGGKSEKRRAGVDLN
jgi:hypothetical protein